MKTFLMLFMISSAAFAQTPCGVPGAPVIEPTIAAVAERFDPEKDNNKCPGHIYPDSFSGINTLDELKTNFNSRMRAMGLSIDWGAQTTGNGTWAAFGDSDLARAKRLANITLASMSLYPAGFFRKAGLRTIKMAKDFRYNFNGDSQARMAMPDPRNDTLVFAENDEPSLTDCPEEVEMRMHHEFFHLMEGTTHGNDMTPNERSYTRLNPEGFRYQNGGAAAYSDSTDFPHREHPMRGFSTGYATFGEEEDRSEVFAYMMTRGFAQRQAGWAATDPILAGKVQWIENFLRTKIKEPSMTADYFDRIEAIPSLRRPSSPSAVAITP